MNSITPYLAPGGQVYLRAIPAAIRPHVGLACARHMLFREELFWHADPTQVDSYFSSGSWGAVELPVADTALALARELQCWGEVVFEIEFWGSTGMGSERIMFTPELGMHRCEHAPVNALLEDTYQAAVSQSRSARGRHREPWDRALTQYRMQQAHALLGT